MIETAPGRFACYVTLERRLKTMKMMWALALGCEGRVLHMETLDTDVRDHAVWGQLWTAERLIPQILALGHRAWHLDNGWFDPARGGVEGYYRITLNQPGPVFLPDAPRERAAEYIAGMRPWRQTGEHVVVCEAGPFYGRPYGLDMEGWNARILERVRAVTDRPIIHRSKATERPLWQDLQGAWCLVTHSSAAAVDAVRKGIPAITEPGSPTEPLGNVGLEWIADPQLADDELRAAWCASLIAQQFTLPEMRQGVALEGMRAILSKGVAPGS